MNNYLYHTSFQPVQTHLKTLINTLLLGSSQIYLFFCVKYKQKNGEIEVDEAAHEIQNEIFPLIKH